MSSEKQALAMNEKAPISPVAGPGRVETFASTATSSSDALAPESGDVGGLIVERLRAYKHAVDYLEKYISQTETLHKILGKEYTKVLKTVDEPLREGHHFSQAPGGIASFFETLRGNTSKLSVAHTECAVELKSGVLPILERLHKEIKDRQKHVAEECERKAKAVAKARNSTQNQVELLGTWTSAFDGLGGADGKLTKIPDGKMKPENDPFLLKKGVIKRLEKQVLEENAQRQDLIGVQNHTQQFEGHIVSTIQSALNALNTILSNQAELQRKMYLDVLEKGNSIPPDFEFVNFLTRNAETLIDPAAPKRTVEAISFPGDNHRATIPLIEGAIQRKGTIMRSYNSGYYVVTPAKYLHEFKDHDSVTSTKDPEPEMSLFLPECNISPLTKDGKFVLTGKDTKGLMSSKHDYAFKCGNAAEGQKWYDAISQFCANGTKSAAELSSAATSPAASVAPSVVTAASPAASVAATPVATPAVEQAPPAYEMHAPPAAK
ncbi:PH domain protein [Pyronema domesticum]|nr:PH domain protein [Pyronema domesticum]